MGADLYIRSISEPARWNGEAAFNEAVAKRDALPPDSPDREAAQRHVAAAFAAMYPDEGYFRDSYNGTSVLWTMDLSWWEDVVPLCDDNGNLGGDNLREFIQMVEGATPVVTREHLSSCGVGVDADGGENDLAFWQAYFTAKRQRLLDFLRRAESVGEAIYCSL